MESNELQQRFFQHIKSLLAPNISFADEIAELLNISNDSAYRRIRGEKPITFDELQVLATHYQVSLDQMMNMDSGSILFIGSNIQPGKFNFENYLQGLLANMKTIKSATSKMIWYEAKDMPIFYHFQFKEMAAFKYFFWMKYVLSYPEYSKVKYEDNELVDILHKSGNEIIKTYCEIPCAEMWSIDAVNATLRQIKYFADTGVFAKKESIEMLYGQLAQIISHVQDQAELGEKFLIGAKPTGTPNYQLYFNEVFLGHNSVVVDTDGVETTYINHGVLNYMTTRDKKLCAYTKSFIENTMKKSVLISSVGDKERTRFFNTLQSKIAESKQVVLG